MEHVNCILCSANNTHLLVKKNSFNVVRCNKCNLVYLDPRLDEAELTRLYNVPEDSDINSVAFGQKDIGHDKHKIKKFKMSIQLLKKNRKDIKNLFDLGCSTGIFLGMVAKEGWIPYGCEVNRGLVEKNQKRYGNHVKLQENGRIGFPDRYFDVVALFDVIEHLPDPIATLKEASRVLKDNGLIIITTPNIDGLFPIMTYALLCKTIGVWEHPTPPRHIFQFSKRTLIKTLEKAGFKCVDSRNFENYIPYTVGQLENSIIDVLRINNWSKEDNKHVFGKNNNAKNDNNRIMPSLFFPIKKLPRLMIRNSCWILVNTIYPLARLLRMGDSMVVIAKKKT